MFKKLTSKLPSMPASGFTEDKEESTESNVSLTASTAASSMWGLMKKAQSAASVMVKEGTAKASELKQKAINAADMDALQRRLAALDVNYAGLNIYIYLMLIKYIHLEGGGGM